MLNQAEEDGCYARGGAAGSSLLALTAVELPNPGQTDEWVVLSVSHEFRPMTG
jgi:hypothetical protein